MFGQTMTISQGLIPELRQNYSNLERWQVGISPTNIRMFDHLGLFHTVSISFSELLHKLGPPNGGKLGFVRQVNSMLSCI